MRLYYRPLRSIQGLSGELVAWYTQKRYNEVFPDRVMVVIGWQQK